MLLSPASCCQTICAWRRGATNMRQNGHPDHDACGESALAASRAVGARMLGFLVWAWHWADPEGSNIPWDVCRRLDLSRRARARKRWASAAFNRSEERPV